MNVLFKQEPERNPETRRLAAPRYGTIRTLTASTESISTKSPSDLQQLSDRRKASRWQTDAWDYSEVIGEVHFASAMVGNILSRVRLFPGWITDEDLAPADIQDVDEVSDSLKADARRLLRHLGNSSGGISGLLRDAGMNLFVTGECYLVNTPKKGTFGQKQWEIRSVDELIIEGARDVYLKNSRTTRKEGYQKLDVNSIGRIWSSYPRYSDEADSSLRPLTELMNELLMTNKAVRVMLKSAMNGGILYLPDELSKAGETYDEPDDDDDLSISDEPVYDDDDDIAESLMQAMTAPIADENAASSIVPMVLRGPADSADKIKYITLTRDLPVKLQERADKVLARIISGLDVPSDIVTGVGGLKYSNASVIEDSFYKSHLEPLALLIVDSLTSIYLRPHLRAMGYSDDEVSMVTLWFDPSAIASKPSLAEAANEGYDRHLISSQSWRRTMGFSHSDRPSETELAQRLALERGLLSEQVTEAVLRRLLPGVMEELRQNSMTPAGAQLEGLLNPEPQSEDSLIEEPNNMDSTIQLGAPDRNSENRVNQQAPSQLLEP